METPWCILSLILCRVFTEPTQMYSRRYHTDTGPKVMDDSQGTKVCTSVRLPSMAEGIMGRPLGQVALYRWWWTLKAKAERLLFSQWLSTALSFSVHGESVLCFSCEQLSTCKCAVESFWAPVKPRQETQIVLYRHHFPLQDSGFQIEIWAPSISKCLLHFTVVVNNRVTQMERYFCSF